VINWKQGRKEPMSDTELRNKVTEILFILTNAEKQNQNLYSPLIQIEGSLKFLEDDNLLALYQRLLHGFNAATTDEQSWADDYFTFILQLCDLLNKNRTTVNQNSLTANATISLVPA
jgi:hypothetical protein